MKNLKLKSTEAYNETDVRTGKHKLQIRNQEQHYGHDIVKHKQEAYGAPHTNNTDNNERFDRDKHYNRENRIARKHKLTSRINAEVNKAEHRHAH